MPVRNKPMGTIAAEVIDRLWKGSIDMHIHAAPDPNCVRRVDALETAAAAQQAEMRAIVLKSFFYPTTSEALACRHVAPDVKTFGSVTIAYTTTGGLEHAAETVECHAKMGCKVLWFPAMDAKYCREYLKRDGGIYILNDDGTPKPEVIDILNVAKRYDMVVCSGHMSYEESKVLFETAVNMGITRLVASHPLAELSQFTMEQIHTLADMGVYIEHVYGTLMPRLGNMDPSDYVDCIKAIGAHRTILTSDLAQIWDPIPAEGMRHAIGMMLQFGCTEEEVRMMVQDNPAKLLGLD